MMKRRKVPGGIRLGERKFGIVSKMLLGILVPLFVVLILMSVFLNVQGAKIVNGIMSTELEAETGDAASQVEAFFQKNFGVAETLAGTQAVRDTVANAAEGGLAPLLPTLQQEQKNNAEDMEEVWVITFRTGELLQSDGQTFGPAELDYASRDWYKMVSAAKDTIATGAYSSVDGNQRVITVATPITVNNTMVGVVGIDLTMDRLEQVLAAVQVGESGYITLYDGDNDIMYHPDSSLIDTNAADANYSDNMLTAIENKQESDAMEYTRSETTYYGSIANISGMDYTLLGVMPEAEFDAQTAAITQVVTVGVICCGIVLAVVCVLLALSITRPLKRLDEAVTKLAAGELDVTVETKGRDEISEVGTGVGKIVDRLKEYILYIEEISEVLRQIADGNLIFTLQYDYVGEFAKVKQALYHIRDTLTDTITGISQSAAQVNAGAEQIASGAQILAQGATEQASSVQELSSSVQELSGQATSEANRAVDAGKFLEKIKEEVDRSNQQMDQMRQAMADISTQSDTIRGIIKTIDDIAFQTNILALNAAVEAARAGTAGKGFAVVADEVRNLAGKSAEAARKTNELIENSVQAVKRGESLTKTTAESLATVGEETSKIVDTINEVAQAYHNQADKLSEIAQGVDQIASVVQTNSATAEESAAASQELSGQANMMREQVAMFRMEGGAVPGGASRPAADRPPVAPETSKY